MNPFEPPPGPESVSPRPPRRAGRVIAFALLTAGGFAGATIGCHILSIRIDNPDNPLSPNLSFAERLWIHAQIGIVCGVLVGIAQWIVIRRWIRDLVAGAADRLPERGRREVRDSAWWIVATTGGHLLGAILARPVIQTFLSNTTHGYALFTNMLASEAWIIEGIAEGAAIGTMQWICLRRYVRRAGLWIGGSTAGYLIAHVLGQTIGTGEGLTIFLLITRAQTFAELNMALVSCLQSFFFGLLYGAALGWLLVRLKPSPRYGGATLTDRGVQGSGWPAERDTRLCIYAGLLFFVLGIALPYRIAGNTWGDYCFMFFSLISFGSPLGAIGFFGLFLIPLSALAALRSHAWAIACAIIGTIVSLLPYTIGIITFGYTGLFGATFSSGLLSRNLAGLLMTGGWIVTARRARLKDAAPPGKDGALPP